MSEKTALRAALALNLVMVALDAKGNPAPVPPLQIETEEQKLEYEAAALRKELRKKRRAQGY